MLDISFASSSYVKEDDGEGFGQGLRASDQMKSSPKHPLWISTGDTYGRSLSVEEAKTLRNFINAILGQAKVEPQEVVTKFADRGYTGEEVALLAKRIARDTTSAWSFLNQNTRDEITRHWVLWLEMNLPA